MNTPYEPPAADITHNINANGQITQPMIEALRGTKGWVKLFGVLLFIAGAFTLFASFAIFAMPGLSSAGKGNFPFGLMLGMASMYVLFALIYFFLGLYLLRYSTAITRLLEDGSGESLTAALQQQQKFWRLAGVLALLGFGVAVLGMVAAVVIPMMSR